MNVTKLHNMTVTSEYAGLLSQGMPGEPWNGHPWILADPLTLSQLGGWEVAD